MMTSVTKRQRTLVIGAGVGGLTAALALHRVGQASRLVTREDNFSASGGAVCLMRNAIRILDRLGLGSRIRTLGLPARYGEVYSSTGKRMFTFDLNDYGGSDVLLVPRPQLRQAFLEALPPDTISFETHFKRLDMDERNGRGVGIVLRDMQAGYDYQLQTDRVIGADGGRSAVRSFITRPGASRSTGVTAFRAVSPNCDLTTYPMHCIREIWGHERASLRFGFCRMTPSDVYWWATVDGSGSNVFKSEIATAADSVGGGGKEAALSGFLLRPYGRKLSHQFADFPFDVSDLVEGTHEAAIERTEVRRFANAQNPWLDPSGRVLLVGDAARQADLPYLHHGSSMAIEDGYSLAIALDRQCKAGGSRRPLDEFEEDRWETTKAVHQLWFRFDRLASSRNRISRMLNSQALKLNLVRNSVEASGLERLHGLEALDASIASQDPSGSNSRQPRTRTN